MKWWLKGSCRAAEGQGRGAEGGATECSLVFLAGGGRAGAEGVGPAPAERSIRSPSPPGLTELRQAARPSTLT